MDPSTFGRGLWPVALALSALVVLLMTSFTRQPRARETWVLASICVFVTGAFVEMYGFPVTPYLVADSAARHDFALLAHPAGRFWYALLGVLPDSRARWFGIVGACVVAYGAVLVGASAEPLRRARAMGTFPSQGAFAIIRRPREAGFALMLLGFVLRWPSPFVLVSAPLLVLALLALVRASEREARAAFGAVWEEYTRRTPALFPRTTPERTLR